MPQLVCSVCGKKVRGSPRVNGEVPGDDSSHRKCAGAIVLSNSDYKKEQKSAVRAEKHEKAKARKELTGRDHQGNHDSLTKKEVRGGAKGDRHANGVRQAGRAGK